MSPKKPTPINRSIYVPKDSNLDEFFHNLCEAQERTLSFLILEACLLELKKTVSLTPESLADFKSYKKRSHVSRPLKEKFTRKKRRKQFILYVPQELDWVLYFLKPTIEKEVSFSAFVWKLLKQHYPEA